MTDYTSGTRITDPAQLREIFRMPTATTEEQERASSTVPGLERGQSILDQARAALGILNPIAGAGAAVGETVASGGDLLAAFNPIRWLAGGAGIALIIGGIIIAVK